MSGKKEYATADITVTYDLKRCIHAAECTRGLPAVFDVNAKPWIQPHKAAPPSIAEVVQRCPSGALHFVWRDGRETEPVPTRNEARLCADGPLYLRGNVELHADGKPIARDTRVALCRCGASHNKPYCDNSHEKIGFRHDGRFAAEVAPAPGSGPLKVTVLSNGPLQVEGWLTISTSEGTVAFCGDKCWLCRCGGSANKPFCDGTHKRIGFSG